MSVRGRNSLDLLGDRANEEAFRCIARARPMLVDVLPAREVLPEITDRTVLHAGPALPSGHRIEGALRQTVIGAALLEGWARTEAGAEQMLDAGDLDLQPAHRFGAVATYCGGITPSAPLLVVEDTTTGKRAYNNLNEGRGRALRYGPHDEGVLERLRWFEGTLGPSLRKAIQRLEGVELLPLFEAALQMGDEGHSRQRSASSLLTNVLSRALVSLDPRSDAEAVLRFLAGNETFFLNVGMAAAKATLSSVHVPGSSLVTAMMRNGVEFAIAISAFEDRWFAAPVAAVDARLFPGFEQSDVNPDIGDSAILECIGLGAFSFAAAPALHQVMGLEVSEAERITLEMYAIVHGPHPSLRIPRLDRGIPTGIDVRKVASTGVTPITNTGVAHRDGRTGHIGFGYVRTPLAAFEQASAELRAQTPNPTGGAEALERGGVPAH
jgi:hypothetical protein